MPFVTLTGGADFAPAPRHPGRPLDIAEPVPPGSNRAAQGDIDVRFDL